MKQRNALAYLRQLRCSGLSKEIVIPEFLHAVQTLLPSENNTFTGVDEQLNPVYHITEFGVADLVEHTPVIKADFVLPESKSHASDWFVQRPALTETTVSDQSFRYNLVLRNTDQHYCLHAPVMQECKPVGMLNLFRPHQQKTFDHHEQSLFSSLLPYATHALTVPEQQNICYCHQGLSGMMILDSQGKITYLSNEAEKLLSLAYTPVLSVNTSSHETDVVSKLVQLCRNLEAIFLGQCKLPSSCCHTGPNGRFIFRAYHLNGASHESGNLIGMTIEHQEPLVLRILRGLQYLPLSPSQKEVSLLLAQGVSSEKIGEQLHIKLSTVKDHIGKIFTKLDIHHREELLPKLQVLDCSIHYPGKSECPGD